MKRHSVQMAWVQRLAMVCTLVLASVLVWPTGQSSAALLNSRSINMSTSAISATSVTYTVTFTPATSVTNPDIMIEFCSNTPTVGNSCTATPGTDVPNLLTASATGWVVTNVTGNLGGVKLTGSGTNLTAGTPKTITINGVTNPSTAGTYYARIITYATGGANTHTSASPGTYIDYGGISLSSTNTATPTINFSVYESLTFCVYQTACGTPANLTLGNATTQALSLANTYINSNAKFTIGSNANNGVNVSLVGTTLCRTSGAACVVGNGSYAANTITPIGSTAATISTGNEQFGLCVDKNGSADLTVASMYADSVNACSGLAAGPTTYSGTSKFAFDDNTATGTNSTSGSQLFSSNGPVTTVSGTFSFIGNIAATTEAGNYNTSLNVIASGTF